MPFAAGQKWTYRAQPELAQSRIVIGALLEFEAGETLACCTVIGALQRMPDGSTAEVTIPFLPMTRSALASSVIALDGAGEVAPGFADQYQAWSQDERGLSYFTVPFEGSLDRMIALQMSEIVESGPAG